MNTRHAGISALMAMLMLAGCSSINQFMGREESIDYKSTAPRRDPLSIPPDLTQAANEPRYRATATGTATFSDFQHQGQTQQVRATAGAQLSTVLPPSQDMRVERDGDLRWLVIDRPAEQLFPRVVDFWTETGFALEQNSPKAGLIETNWAENRANIPESWLRQALGLLLESAYDSGQREKFRTRLERVGNRTEIYISHRKMLEKRYGNDNGQVEWAHAPEDPGLNAAMLARLMVFLGTDIERARTVVAQAELTPLKPAVQLATAEGATLRVGEPFDRSWRRVGIALDSGGFSVDDRDRSAGEYFVRYVDTDTGVQNEQPGLFSRIFGRDKRTEAAQYRIKLVGQGDQTIVSVLDATGQPDGSATAIRLLGVLRDKM